MGVVYLDYSLNDKGKTNEEKFERNCSHIISHIWEFLLQICFLHLAQRRLSLVIPLVVRYITSEVVHWEKQSGAAHDFTTGRDHAGTDRCSVLLQLFYIELRTCYGRKDRVRHACRDFFTLSETVLPFLR